MYCGNLMYIWIIMEINAARTILLLKDKSHQTYLKFFLYKNKILATHTILTDMRWNDILMDTTPFV